MTPNKVGVMLSGGGAKGAYQVGFLKGLVETKLHQEVNVFSGSSIGAINAAYFIMTNDTTYMERAWKRFLAMKKVPRKQLFNVTLENEKKDGFDEERLKDSKYQLYVSVSKIIKDVKNPFLQMLKRNLRREVIYINEASEPQKSVFASAALPLLFGKVRIANSDYVDGGFLDDNPLEKLIEIGCDVIFLVSLSKKCSLEKYQDKNILFIDFQAKELFSPIPLIGALEVIRFNKKYIEMLETAGYWVFNKIFDKLLQKEIVAKQKEHLSLKKPEGFTYISLDCNDKIELRKYLRSKTCGTR